MPLSPRDAGLTGTHVGCDTSQCGACTVLVDGRALKSCTMLAVQADGREILTIEGLARDGALHPLQEGFWQRHGLQCGFCTTGMIMTAYGLLRDNPSPTEDEIRAGLAGTLCRCTGYHNIVRAVQYAAERMAVSTPEPTPRSRARTLRTRRSAAKPAPRRRRLRGLDHGHHTAHERLIGAAIPRREDRRFITGRGLYTDDIQTLPGTVYCAFVRSRTRAHASAPSLSTRRAAPRSVHAIYTGCDLAGAVSTPSHPAGSFRTCGSPTTGHLPSTRHDATWAKPSPSSSRTRHTSPQGRGRAGRRRLRRAALCR